MFSVDGSGNMHTYTSRTAILTQVVQVAVAAAIRNLQFGSVLEIFSTVFLDLIKVNKQRFYQ